MDTPGTSTPVAPVTPVSSTIVILDFGSQYTQLIARRIREFNVFSVVLPCTTPLEKVLALEPKGIVLSGGPSSVYDDCGAEGGCGGAGDGVAGAWHLLWAAVHDASPGWAGGAGARRASMAMLR